MTRRSPYYESVTSAPDHQIPERTPYIRRFNPSSSNNQPYQLIFEKLQRPPSDFQHLTIKTSNSKISNYYKFLTRLLSIYWTDTDSKMDRATSEHHDFRSKRVQAQPTGTMRSQQTAHLGQLVPFKSTGTMFECLLDYRSSECQSCSAFGRRPGKVSSSDCRSVPCYHQDI